MGVGARRLAVKAGFGSWLVAVGVGAFARRHSPCEQRCLLCVGCAVAIHLRTGSCSLSWDLTPAQFSLLTSLQVMVALDSFKVPRMDMWRREMYAAAGYRLYKYPNWRQRVRVQPGFLAAGAGFGRRRLGRRSGSGAGSGSGRLPPVLRSGDWGVMDAMGGAGGVLGGSMGSYEELSAVSQPQTPAGGGGGAVKRTLPDAGLVRPQRPSSSASSSSSVAESSTSSLGSMWEGGF
jgi:hypothetical protein